jgi:Mrp family chromosome partitioning ATPase
MSRILEALKRMESQKVSSVGRVVKTPPRRNLGPAFSAAMPLVSADHSIDSELPNAEIACEENLKRLDSLIRSDLEKPKRVQRQASDPYLQMSQYILAQIDVKKSSVLFFTSPHGREGKSKTLWDLSKTIVKQISGNVLVVDANFRHPDFTRVWAGRFTDGLEEALKGSAEWCKTIYNTEVNRLAILPNKGQKTHRKRGGSPDQWGNLFIQLKTHFKLVLVDGSSLINAQTASCVSRCDGIYMAVRLGFTKPHEVRESVSVIRQVGGRLLGVIAVGG